MVKIYRRRFIPDEMILLKDDIVLSYEPGKLLLTSWKSIKPRKDIARGVSAYLPEKGLKISKIYDHNDNIIHWYCDIVQVIENPEENSLTAMDLLFDVIVKEDGTYRVVDIDEAADAYRRKLITRDQLLFAMDSLDRLLKVLYSGEFNRYKQLINNAGH